MRDLAARLQLPIPDTRSPLFQRVNFARGPDRVVVNSHVGKHRVEGEKGWSDSRGEGYRRAIPDKVTGVRDRRFDPFTLRVVVFYGSRNFRQEQATCLGRLQ